MTEKEAKLGEWADAIQDGSIEFLELALEMKEADQSYEWPYLMGLFMDQMAAVVRGNPPKMTKVQQKHAIVAFEAFRAGYEAHRNVADVKLFDKAENLFNQATSLWATMAGVFGIKAPLPPKPEKKEQLPLPSTEPEAAVEVSTDYDVVVTLPAGTSKDKEERILQKVQDLLTHAGGGTCAVIVGKTEAKMVKVRAGSGDQYDAIIEEVLRGHIPVPEKTETTPTETSTSQA